MAKFEKLWGPDDEEDDNGNGDGENDGDDDGAKAGPQDQNSVSPHISCLFTSAFELIASSRTIFPVESLPWKPD